MRYRNRDIDLSGSQGVTGTTVFVKDGNVDKALRKLKKKMQDDGKLMQLQKKAEYIKPTTLRKQKKAQARKRWLKKLASEKLPEKKY
jgi:small subunit ribosomal protein S21